MKRISALIVGTTLILAGIALQPLPAIAGDHDDDDDIDIVESPFINFFDDELFPGPFNFPRDMPIPDSLGEPGPPSHEDDEPCEDESQ